MAEESCTDLKAQSAVSLGSDKTKANCGFGMDPITYKAWATFKNHFQKK